MPNDAIENEYFTRMEARKKEKLKQLLESQQANTELEERRKLHWNRCGRCGAEMRPQQYRNVEIDVCPECGTVLLDPGELEQLAGDEKSGGFRGLLSVFGRK